MKKVKLYSDGKYNKYLGMAEEESTLFCPMGKIDKLCDTCCAWFDIEDRHSTVVIENGTITRVIIKTVTCKGTPIAELVEE